MNGATEVLLAVERWEPTGGGRERYAAELAAALERRGRAVSIVCAHAEAAAHHPLQAWGSLLGLRGAVSRWRAGHPDAPALGLFTMPEASHVQLHSGLAACAAAADRQAFGPGLRRLCFTPAGSLNRRRRQRAANESETCDGGRSALMAFSRHDADALTRLHRIGGARITLARPGIDTGRFAPSPASATRSPTAPLRVVFAGHNFRLKGLMPALDAIARVRRPVTLTIAGASWRLPFEWRARLRGVAGLVRFRGNLSQEELAALFRSSDVLLHPAYYDPFPRAVLEAMACGCVPIVTRQCGVSEVLESGGNGFVADSPDATADIATWLDGLHDARALADLRDAAIQRARAFDFNGHADDVAAWLRGDA